ncbi:MAG: hypothetical protein QW328_07130 [Nitrososphaerota archaeon]
MIVAMTPKTMRATGIAIGASAQAGFLHEGHIPPSISASVSPCPQYGHSATV